LAAHGITHIHRAVTDNGACYRSRDFARIADTKTRHQKTRPFTPRHNGKAERYQRIMAEEVLYAGEYTCEDERSAAISVWSIHYNYHRRRSAAGARPPASRLKTGVTGILEELGYTVDVADDGIQALDAHARASYDAVLMGVRQCQPGRPDAGGGGVRLADVGAGSERHQLGRGEVRGCRDASGELEPIDLGHGEVQDREVEGPALARGGVEQRQRAGAAVDL
jgi:hypothetical protein